MLLSTAPILFLDEIHLLSPVNQHALLQVLDKRRIFLSSGKSVQSIPVSDFHAGRGNDGPGRADPAVDGSLPHGPASGLLQP